MKGIEINWDVAMYRGALPDLDAPPGATLEHHDERVMSSTLATPVLADVYRSRSPMSWHWLGRSGFVACFGNMI